MTSPISPSHLSLAFVEDDDDLRSTMESYFSARGYCVWSAPSAEAFYKRFLAEPTAIVVLDIGLPGDSGFEVAQQLSRWPQTRIIIVSGSNSFDARMRGLTDGADRYLVKPVDLRELEANIQATGRSLSPAEEPSPEGAWQLHATDWLLESPEGGQVSLTSKEWLFLSSLFRAPQGFIERRELSSILTEGRSHPPSDSSIDMLVSRLRRKIKAHCGQTVPLKTRKSVGFVFTSSCCVLDA